MQTTLSARSEHLWGSHLMVTMTSVAEMDGSGRDQNAVTQKWQPMQFSLENFYNLIDELCSATLLRKNKNKNPWMMNVKIISNWQEILEK